MWISFPRERERELQGKSVGLPIGNLTSQIFANIYLNELDQFIKNDLRIRYYFRYADDFVIVHNDRIYLEQLVKLIRKYLNTELKLDLHPYKVTVRKFSRGVDFLGYIILPYHTVLRTKTRRRMFTKLFMKQELFTKGVIGKVNTQQSLQSYLGLLKHCQGYELSSTIRNNFTS